MALLEIKDLKIYFEILQGQVRAVDGVSFNLDRGETMGLVGESGCGKTTTAFTIMRLLPENADIVGGEVVFNGQVAAWSSLAQELFQIVSDVKEDLPVEGNGWIKSVHESMSRKEGKLQTLANILPVEFAEDDRRVMNEIKPIMESGQPPEALLKTLKKYLHKEIKGFRGGMRTNRREKKLENAITKVRWAQVSMIFQSAMNAFNPVYKVGDQIMEAILTHPDAFERPYCPTCDKRYMDYSSLKKNEQGIHLCPKHETPMQPKDLTKADARKIALELFDIVGLSRRRLDGYPHEFSGGMRQRAMIAMALACNPPLIIADEPTTALDVIMQDRILAEIRDLQKRLGIAMLIITHDVSVVAEVGEKIGIMYAGKLVEHGDVKSIFTKQSHPYTIGLLGAFPNIKKKKEILKAIPGSPPDLANPPSGCRFHPRCSYAVEKCKQVDPPLIEVSPNHFSACFFARELFSGEKGG